MFLAPFPSRELGGCGGGYWERARVGFCCFRFLGPLLGIFTRRRTAKSAGRSKAALSLVLLFIWHTQLGEIYRLAP